MNLNSLSKFIFFGQSKLRLKKIKCLPKQLSTTQLRSCLLLLSFILIYRRHWLF